MALLFLVLSFTKLLWFHRQGWVVPNSPDLSPLDYYVGENAEAATKAINSSSFWVERCALADLVCGMGESNQQCHERFAQPIAGKCVSKNLESDNWH